MTRAAVLTEMGLPRPDAQSRPLKVSEMALDPPGPGGILVRVGATSANIAKSPSVGSAHSLSETARWRPVRNPVACGTKIERGF